MKSYVTIINITIIISIIMKSAEDNIFIENKYNYVCGSRVVTAFS